MNSRRKDRGRTFVHFDSLCFEELTQFLDFLLELSNEFRVGVLINHSLAHNLLRSVRVSASVNETIHV